VTLVDVVHLNGQFQRRRIVCNKASGRGILKRV
jgi:hypothetical protein